MFIVGRAVEGRRGSDVDRWRPPGARHHPGSSSERCPRLPHWNPQTAILAAPEGGTSVWSEYGVGDYFRSFEAGDIVDADRISATYADGVLTVRLPKVEAARPRKIPVNIET